VTSSPSTLRPLPSVIRHLPSAICHPPFAIWNLPHATLTDANTHGLEGLGLGIMFQGAEATLVANYDTYKLLPEKGRALHEPPKTLPRSVGHHREWLNAIKSRAQCSCNFAYGHRLSSVDHLGNIALRTSEKLKWDAAAERITNHPEANTLLTKECRKPWALPEV